MSDTGMILQRIGAMLVSEVAPKLEGDYSGGQAGMAGMLSAMAGEMWDKEADLLIGEITRLRGLFAAADRNPGVPEAESFKLSDLRKTRNTLAERLIVLQADLEGQPDEAASVLNAKIWAHLLMTSAARMPSPPVFAAAED